MKLIINEFIQYEMTPEEELQSKLLSTEQAANIQNHLSRCAVAKLQLIYDSNNPVASMQAEAEIQGQIGILKLLLQENEDARITLATPTYDL